MEKLYIKYIVNDRVFEEEFLNSNINCVHFDFIKNNEDKETIWKIIPKNNYRIKLIEVCLKKDVIYAPTTQVFCNGYQSWSYSGIYNRHEKQDKLSKPIELLTKKIGLKTYSDYYFYDKKVKKGIFRSYSYTYIKTKNDYLLYGSLDESFAFTIFRHNMNKNLLEIYKDISGRVVDKETVLYNFITLNGEYTIQDDYFTKLTVKNKRTIPSKLIGYTSWYNYYQNIDDKKMNTALDSLTDSNLFQIDDGYQTFVGDWLDIDKNKFPDGLKPLVDKTHEKDMLAGLWLAPFVCEENSNLFKHHKDYLLKDSLGKPYYLGNNWSNFYALDITKEPVKNYLKKCFEHVFSIGFDLVKVDFLYAACLMPNDKMTRSELMNYGTSLLREWCGDKLILGCGVPLSSAYNKFDYCRIGCDVSLSFDGGYSMKLIDKIPAPSTKNSIINTINRNPMNNKVFINDPDVFILRKDNQKLDNKQKYALAVMNTIMGGVNLHSDIVNELPDISKKVLEKLPEFYDMKVINITKYVSTYKIHLKKDDEVIEIDYNFIGGYILD